MTSLKLLLLATSCGCLGFAQTDRIQALLESVVSGGPQASPAMLDEVFSSVAALSDDDLIRLLPIGLQSLRSSNPLARNTVEMYLTSVAMRYSDGAHQLEPYLTDLAALIDRSKGRERIIVFYIIASANPKPSSGDLAVLAAHLSDPADTDEEFVTIASALILAVPQTDTSVLHRVFEIAGTRGHSEVAGVLKAIGLASLTSAEALQFVTMALSHTNPGVRESALNIIEGMPEPTRRTFNSALLRVIGRPDETDDIRERARKVLIK